MVNPFWRLHGAVIKEGQTPFGVVMAVGSAAGGRHGQRSAVGSRRPAASCRRPAAGGGQQPAASSRRPAASAPRHGTQRGVNLVSSPSCQWPQREVIPPNRANVLVAFAKFGGGQPPYGCHPIWPLGCARRVGIGTTVAPLFFKVFYIREAGGEEIESARAHARARTRARAPKNRGCCRWRCRRR